MKVFCAVADRMGIETGIDLYKIMDIAEDMIEDLALDMAKAQGKI